LPGIGKESLMSFKRGEKPLWTGFDIRKMLG
jgi:hypothetical protein